MDLKGKKISNTLKEIDIKLEDMSIHYDKTKEELQIKKTYGNSVYELGFFNKQGLPKRIEVYHNNGDKDIDYYLNNNISKKEYYDKDGNLGYTKYAKDKPIIKTSFISSVSMNFSDDNLCTFALYKNGKTNEELFKTFSVDLDNLICKISENNEHKYYNTYGELQETQINKENGKEQIYYFDDFTVSITRDMKGIKKIKSELDAANNNSYKISEEMKEKLIQEGKITEKEWKNYQIRLERENNKVEKEERITYQHEYDR